MSAILKINNFISAFIDALKSIFYIRLWTPFFIFFLISIAFAYMILNPFSGPWSGFVTWIGASSLFGGGEAFTHYPQHLLISPSVHSHLNLVLSIIVDSLLTGAAFIIFAGFFRAQKVKFSEAVSRAFSSYHWLVLASAVIYAILYAVQLLLPEIFMQMLIGNPRRMFFFIVALKLFMFLVFSPLVYTIPYIVLKNENFFSAFLNSIRFFLKNIFTTFFAIFITQLVVLPFSLSLDYSGWIADKF
ncbi:MAG TPA: hypothetical protein ENO07_05140, partial [candidate division Zixibacteria bacterium]|nr:hypothetical protein [candidate division Zixibacteria bacterium]